MIPFFPFKAPTNNEQISKSALLKERLLHFKEKEVESYDTFDQIQNGEAVEATSFSNHMVLWGVSKETKSVEFQSSSSGGVSGTPFNQILYVTVQLLRTPINFFCDPCQTPFFTECSNSNLSNESIKCKVLLHTPCILPLRCSKICIQITSLPYCYSQR